MTELQLLYAKARLGGRGHHAALRALGEKTGLDAGTIQRCLRRAERTDEREAKSKKAAA